MTTSHPNGDARVLTRGQRITLTALKVVAWILIVPGGMAMALSLLALLQGDGFTDAAPWWVVLLLVAGALGVPGIILLLAARFIKKGLLPPVDPADTH